MTIEQIIYGDVLLLINFSMDFTALYITAKLLNLKIKTKRMVLSAALGALYSLAIVALNVQNGSMVTLSIAFSLLLCLISFGKTKLTVFFKRTTVYYITNFLMGGGITAIGNLLNLWKNSRDISINGTHDVIYGEIPFCVFILTAVFCAMLSFFGGKYINTKKASKCAVTVIKNNGREVQLVGLFDSGNLLTEPLTERRVIVANYAKIKPVIPLELLSFFKSNGERDLKKITDTRLVTKLRVIPSVSVGGQSLLYGFIPDFVSVNGLEVDAIVAVDTKIEKFDEFDAVIPTALSE